ncbi:unnamed protein product [Arctogadus glacialis]
MLSVAHGLENTNYRHIGIWAAIRTSPKTLPSDCANCSPGAECLPQRCLVVKNTSNYWHLPPPPLLPSVGSRGRRRSRQEEQNRWGDRTPAASMGGPWPRPPRPYSFQLGRSSRMGGRLWTEGGLGVSPSGARGPGRRQMFQPLSPVMAVDPAARHCPSPHPLTLHPGLAI